MTPEQAWTIAGAILTSLAGGGAIVLALSSWLARSWARRMLEEDRARYHAELDAVKHTYTHELERLKEDLAASNRKLHGHIDHAVFVSRPQFEAEFRTLTNTWERIADLRAVFRIKIGFDDFELHQQQCAIGATHHVDARIERLVIDRIENGAGLALV